MGDWRERGDLERLKELEQAPIRPSAEPQEQARSPRCTDHTLGQKTSLHDLKTVGTTHALWPSGNGIGKQ